MFDKYQFYGIMIFVSELSWRIAEVSEWQTS